MILLLLMILGAAEDASSVFGEAAVLCIQKQYLHHRSENLQTLSDELNSASARNNSSDDVRTRQSKHTQSNNLRDIPTNYHGAVNLGGAASQIVNGGSNISFYNTPSPVAAQVCKSDHRSWY